MTTIPQRTEPVRYVPIGDSLTIGQGVAAADAWPTLLTNHLQQSGFDISLIENIARSGWTSQQALEYQLPRFRELNGNFATVLIGANDLFRGVSPADFKAHFVALVDGLLAVVPNKYSLVVMTIPDYTRTPLGFVYGGREEYDVEDYNDIIRAEAKTRDLPLVDIYKESKWVMFDIGLLSDDGIHPSVKGHQQWEKVIYPVVEELL